MKRVRGTCKRVLLGLRFVNRDKYRALNTGRKLGMTEWRAAGGEGLTDGPQSDSAGEPQGVGMSGGMGGGGSGSGGGPAEGGEAAEREAKAALDALKEATLIRSKKADWRLVAAAQAIRRGEFKDEFEAAAAMGKSISRRREVESWSKKLEELEQRQAPTRRSSRLLVQHPWVQAHLPGVQVLEPPSPVPTEHGHHATRRLAAVVSTPGGSVQQLEGEVSYTLPPADGESGTAAKRRDDRHRRREEAALRRFDISGCAVAEQRSKVLCSMRAAREVHSQISELLQVMVTEVERLNSWTEDHGFHWLPLSPLQLLHWPSKMGYTHGQFGMPLCQGDWAWLVDPQNDRAPRLASVNRWFSNGHVEFNMLSDDMRPTELPPVVLTPEPGVVLPLDERRPRYVGERVRLWGKHHCAAIRGTSDDVEARAASATTCPDYRPLEGSCKFVPTMGYGINEALYTFEELGWRGDSIYDTNRLCHGSLERADSLLEGRSELALVAAVHPGDRFVVSSTTWQGPRKFFVQSRSGETGAHYRLGKSEVTEDVLWATGSIDLVLFDARSGTYTGPALDRVPLYLVNGAGYGASLLEAKLIAHAELFRLFQDDWESALIDPALNRLADTADAEQLASELCSWPSSIGMQPSDDVIERLRSLQEAVALEARLQEFVHGLMVQQHGKVSLEDLIGQQRFPDKLPDPGVTYKRVLQDYDPDPPFRAQRQRDHSGIRRTDYLLW